MKLATITTVAMLGAGALANNGVDLSLGPPNAKCVRSTYPISVSSNNIDFSNYTAPRGIDNTTFITALQQRNVTILFHNAGH
jgi:hypothetical protein